MAEARRRLLVLSPIEPCRTGNGLAMRTAAFVDAVSDSWDVRVVVAPLAGRSPAGPRPDVPVSVVGTEPARHGAGITELMGDAGWRGLLGSVTPFPSVLPAASLGMAAEVAAASGFGLGTPVHVMRSYLAPLGVLVARHLGSPWTSLDLDDDDEALARDMDQPAEAAAWSRLVGAFAPRFSACWAASPAVSAAISARHGLDVGTVVNCVALPALSGGPRVSAEALGPARLLFLGNLSYQPNQEAARWLAETLLPEIRRRSRRAVTVVLAGPGGDGLSDLAGLPAVELIGFVSDVATVYAGASVAVVPLRHASGTRIKLLEAFARHVPVVTTPAGAAGLEVEDGRELLIAEGVEGLAVATARVLADPGLAERLRRAGRAFVESSHSPEVVARQVAYQLERARGGIRS